ncbi:MAG: acetyl-CoA decarbonylase/synthase complex subunit gamma [Chloroflexota bacterium]|nr:MAG: acetyl-CoA decarbonylase/synthase complex subunit gamma [Chloroflexota bacterium]
MALSGIEIYKHLPKTNCKKCGFPTCLAFAMKLAQKGIELSACPDLSDAAKQALEAASRPPIRLVTIGNNDKKLAVGNETVMFRHEKTFINPPGLLLRVKDTESANDIAEKAKSVQDYAVERVGFTLTMNGVAVDNASGDKATFVKAVEIVSEHTDRPLVLMAKDPAIMEAALEKVATSTPLIYAATKDNAAAMAQLALKYKCPLAVYDAGGLEELAGLAQEVANAGVEDIVLDPGARDFRGSLINLTQIRKLALKKGFKDLGYPIITFPGEQAADRAEEVALAAQHIAKYAGVIVLDTFDPAVVYPLVTLRLNIYTDPQKPIQMQPGLYEVAGNPKADSPLFVTTNFSLTYFSVVGEIDGSGVASWLVLPDAEGLSVLTAWAAGKFDGERIGKAIKASGVADKISHKKVIIPGHVAVLRGEIEDELPGWEVIVGPKDAVDIPGFLKKIWTLTPA